MKKITSLALAVAIFFSFNACKQPNKAKEQKQETPKTGKAPLPDWAAQAVVYEVNIRQYTPEGTFNAFEAHLPRLKELGVNVLWFMPMYPIGEKNRKGPLGSYYSIKNYKAVNPEFGNMEDFKSLVNKCHEMGFKVLLDWVGNHTAWDHAWVSEHPDWYKKDSTGAIMPPVPDWHDVAALNYENKALWQPMLDAMLFWVKEAGVDGYRCDYAGGVPTKFWLKANHALNEVKPVFMLAENEDEPDLLKEAFNANYGWEAHHIMNEIVKGNKTAADLKAYFAKTDTVYPQGTFPLQFTSNHDENSWNGTVEERLGDAAKTFAALTFVVEGMPLVYSGQEAGLDKRLKFFEKDLIDWSDLEMSGFYRKLTSLKKEHPALWNGVAGGEMEFLEIEGNPNAFAFKRSQKDDAVIAVFNLSDKEITINFKPGAKGNFTEVLTGKDVDFPISELSLKPWQFAVYVIR